LLEALLDIFARFNIVAFDNVELAPSLDPSGRSTALACKLLREELLGLGTGIETGMEGSSNNSRNTHEEK